MEGNATEKEYFEAISANRKALGINAIVDIEVLNRRRKDTNSAPEHVVELLEEYLRLREYGRESLVNDIPNNFVEKYGIDFIQNYLQGEEEISRKQKNEFVTDLLKIGYACYIANPCFEFWLLLHLSDVKKEYRDRMLELKENRKVSDKHTFVSKEVSEKAHHGKSGINFRKNYMPYIDVAISRAKEFASTEDELVDNIGCNVWKLVETLKNYKL